MEIDKIIRDLSDDMDDSRFFAAWEEMSKESFLVVPSQIFTKFIVDIVYDFYKKFNEYRNRDNKYPLYYMVMDVTTVHITFERRDQVTFSKHDWLRGIEDGDDVLYEGFKGTMNVYVKPLKCTIRFDVTFDNDRECFVVEDTRHEITGDDFFGSFMPKSYMFEFDNVLLEIKSTDVFHKVKQGTYEEYKYKLGE